MFRATLQILKNYHAHHNSSKAASIAFYTLFSLSPSLLILVSVLSYLLGTSTATSQISLWINQTVSPQAASTLHSIISQHLSNHSSLSIPLISLSIVLFGSTKIFLQIANALNSIFPSSSKNSLSSLSLSLLHILKTQFIGFILILSLALLLVSSLLLTTAAATLYKVISHFHVFSQFNIPIDTYLLLRLINFLFNTLLITLPIALSLKFIPNNPPPLRSLWLPSLIGSLLFTSLRELLTLYLTHSGITSAYGAAGSLIAFLIWLHASIQIFLLTAEIAAYSHSPIPTPQNLTAPSPQ